MMVFSFRSLLAIAFVSLFGNQCSILETKEDLTEQNPCFMQAVIDTISWDFNRVLNSYMRDSVFSLSGSNSLGLPNHQLGNYGATMYLDLNRPKVISLMKNGKLELTLISDSTFSDIFVTSLLIERDGDVFFSDYELQNNENFAFYLDEFDTTKGTIKGRFDFDFIVTRRSSSKQSLPDTVRFRAGKFQMKLEGEEDLVNGLGVPCKSPQ